MRCEKHGLAAGPSGECVVCLRETRAREARRVLRLCVWFFVSVLGACGALLAFRVLRSSVTVPGAEPAATLAPPPQVAAPASASAAGAPSTAGMAAAGGDANAGQPVAVASAGASESTDAGATPFAVALAPSAEPASSAQAPTSEQVLAAVRATPVLMFSTTWCPHCQRARQFFRANGLSVLDRDIDADPSAAAELKRRTGRQAIPVIEIDGQQLQPGFSEQATLQAVASSVQRRLGGARIRFVPASAQN
jgi:glutaredoxin